MTAGQDAGRQVNRSIVAWAPAGLALVAEAAWLAVVGGLLQAFVLQPPAPGVLELLVVCVAGLLAARRLGPGLGDRWPGVAAALATACGMAGWLLSPEVRAILAADGLAGIGSALAANPGGWLLWPAFVRGMAYARLPVEPRRVAVMIVAVVPGLALCALAGGMVGEPTRSTYLDAARVDVILFLATAIPALALARLGALAAGTSLDWSRNPAWLTMVAVLLGATAVTGLVVAATAGAAITAAIATLLVPLLLVGFIVGFDRRSMRILFASLLAAGVIGTLLGMFEEPSRQGSATGSAVSSAAQEAATQTGLAMAILVIVLALAVLAVMILARVWLRRSPPAAPGDFEVREIAHDGEVARATGGRRRRTRRAAPTDAVTAYRALLDDLRGRPFVAREPGETPAEHARRLRAAGAGSLGLDLLAADYGLARFAGAPLSDAENRRALARSAALRRRLAAVGREVARTGAQPARGRPVAAPSGPVVRGTGRLGDVGADLPDIEQPGVAETLLTRIRRGH
jgi:hypothetical protein